MPSPMNKRIPGLGPFLLLLLCACGGNGDGTRGIQPPGGFAVTSAPLGNFYELEFTWTPPPGSVDGYNLQGSVGAGGFQALNTTLIPENTSGGTLDLDPSTPERTDFLFRIDAVKGSQTSGWAQAPFHLGIKPATFFSGTVEPALATIHLTWTANSTVADSLTLRRTAFPPGAPATVTTLAPPALGATTYDDTDLHENTTYDYLLTYNKGDESSAAADSGDMFYDLNAPEHLVVTTGASSANLTWTLTSALTSEIRVYRRTAAGSSPSPSGVLTTLPAAAREYTDTGLTPGIYTYEVDSYEATTGAEERSGWVTACTQPAPLDGQTFQVQYTSMAWAPSIQPDAQGGWLLWPVAMGAASYGLELWTPSGSTQQFYTKAAGWLSEPPILMDAGSQPHMAWVDEAYNLVHLWRSTAGWQTETVATDATPFANQGGELAMPFLQAPDGTLHLFYATGAPSQYMEAIRGTAGWTFQADPSLAKLSALAIDPSGTLHGLQYGLAVGGLAQPLILWSRAADGTWSSQQVPGGGTLSPALFQVDGTGIFHFLFVKPADASGPQGTVHVAQQAGVWSQPEVLTSESPQALSGEPPMYLSVCPLDQRVFFSSNFPEGTVVFARDPDGAWSSTTLLPASTYPYDIQQGLAASGKVYLVLGLGPNGTTGGTAVFVEQ